MLRSKMLVFVTACLFVVSCDGGAPPASQPVDSSDAQETAIFVDPFWRNAVVYFIMTDRFRNGDPANDLSAGRADDGAVLRGFHGGDIRGITQMIESGYFAELGVDVIWTTPLIENIHGAISDSYGKTYAYHGYWPLDWTSVDPNFGSEDDLEVMIEAAHARGIRVIADVIVNQHGSRNGSRPGMAGRLDS